MAEAAVPDMAQMPPRKPDFSKPQAGEKPAAPAENAFLAHLPPRRPALDGGKTKQPPAAPVQEAVMSPAQATASGRYEVLAAIEGDGQCGIASPILLSSLMGEEAVAVSPAATLSIDIFAPLETWMEGVQALATEHLGQWIVEVRNAADYVCRGRNNVKGAPISQHAFGRAFDVYGFRLADGDTVTLTENWGKDDAKGRFLKKVEALNCAIFKTALGPNANKHHRDHFHIDLGPETRKSHYCR